jgi:TPP-dependent pyruvate/acetoin dehydrogenase alpha subunit
MLDNNNNSGDFDLYSQMLWIRKVEEKIASEYHKQEMRCPVHLSIGQEAVPVGISACLQKDDHVVSAHRSHAHYLAKGGSLDKMLGELFGKVSGCARGKGGSMHLVDLDVNVTAAVPIVGSSISIGTGIGLGLKQNNSESKVVVYFGDGATEEGVFSESIDFAALFSLPVLFVCENNFYSVYTPTNLRQSKSRSLKVICEGHGIKFFQGNGNDVLNVKNVTKQAIEYMNREQKPVLLEFETYRWLEHCGPNWDDHLGYRAEGELDGWMDKCPIKNLRAEKKLSDLPKSYFEDFERSIELKIENSFEFARSSEFPDLSELHQHIYAD